MGLDSSSGKINRPRTLANLFDLPRGFERIQVDRFEKEKDKMQHLSNIPLLLSWPPFTPFFKKKKKKKSVRLKELEPFVWLKHFLP